MKLVLAIILWLIIAAVIAAGVVLAVQGKAWLLAVSLLAFTLAFARIGCRSH